MVAGSSGDADHARIGAGYTRYRQPEPHVAAIIKRALGNASSVLNVGAGAGYTEQKTVWVQIRQAAA